MCESDRPVTEIVEYFGTTVKTIHQRIIKNSKNVGRNGSIYTVSLIVSLQGECVSSSHCSAFAKAKGHSFGFR